MAERPIIRDPGFEHGANGYRKGCGCLPCRSGHNKRIADARAKRRGDTAVDTSRPVSHSHKSGKVEQTVRRELKEVPDCLPPWVQTLHELAIQNARAIDEAIAGGKIQLVSPLQGKLLDVLDRIRTAPVVAGVKPAVSVGDEAEDFVNGLTKFGGTP